MTDNQPDRYGTPSLVNLGSKYRLNDEDSDGPILTKEQLAWQEAIGKLSGESVEFDADNLLTNEWSTADPLDVILRDEGEPTGCYIGLGAFQNLTYAAALNVAQVVVLDVRPANIAYFLFMIDLLQQCPTPDQFICYLFSRPDCRPANGSWLNTPDEQEVDSFLESIRSTPLDRVFMADSILRMRKVATAMVDQQLSTYLNPAWAASFMRLCIEYFARFNTNLTYMTWGLGITDRHPTMAHLINVRSKKFGLPTFFTSPLLYARARNLALQWRIIPIVGDLKDRHFATRFVDWQDRQEPVRAIYTSNVENYLVTRGRWQYFDDFIYSLNNLPLDSDAVIIKAYFQYGGDQKHPLQEKWHDCVFVQKVSDLMHAFNTGELKDPLDIYLGVPYVMP